MNPSTSVSIGADYYMEFEDNAADCAVAISGDGTPTPIVATPAVEQLKLQLASLSPPERAELARFLAGSFEFKEKTEEAARRAAEIQAGQVPGKPADRAFTELGEMHS